MNDEEIDKELKYIILVIFFGIIFGLISR